MVHGSRGSQHCSLDNESPIMACPITKGNTSSVATKDGLSLKHNRPKRLVLAPRVHAHVVFTAGSILRSGLLDQGRRRMFLRPAILMRLARFA